MNLRPDKDKKVVFLAKISTVPFLKFVTGKHLEFLSINQSSTIITLPLIFIFHEITFGSLLFLRAVFRLEIRDVQIDKVFV